MSEQPAEKPTTPNAGAQAQLNTLSAVPSTARLSQSSLATVVGVHYKVGKKIGEGSFGVLYEGNFLIYIMIL